MNFMNEPTKKNLKFDVHNIGSKNPNIHQKIRDEYNKSNMSN